MRAVVDTLLNTETALKEVFAEVVGWAMGQDTMWRIGDPCDAENLASARIMKKAPLRREGNPAPLDNSSEFQFGARDWFSCARVA